MSLAPLSLMLVDDSPDFRAAALLHLSKQPGLCVTAMVASGEEALAITRELIVDLILMDISMPGMGGLEATRRLKTDPKAPKVVVVTLEDAPAYQNAAKVVGADGFVTKSDFATSMIPLIASLFPNRKTS